MQNLAKYLKKLRGKMSIRQLAKSTEISNAYLSQMESGEKENPHPEILKKLAHYYKLPVIEFFRQAGYLNDETDTEISMEEKIEQAFLRVISNPDFKFGTRLKNKYDLEGKRFIVEMYEKLTGETLLD
jgi:transcriptional regulator with XRE-family HTH domain